MPNVGAFSRRTHANTYESCVFGLIGLISTRDNLHAWELPSVLIGLIGLLSHEKYDFGLIGAAGSQERSWCSAHPSFAVSK